MQAEMQVSALAAWFGGKRTLAPEIVAELGDHRAYWELFCGSMAVLFSKSISSMETVNDLHGDLVNLARVVQHDSLSVELFGRLNRVACAEPLLRDAAERFKARGNVPAGDLPDLDRATDYFLCSWLGRNGVAGTHSFNQGFCRRFTNNGGHAAKRFASAVESIPGWWERLRAVTILNDDSFDLIDRIEDEPACSIYCDPPYLVKGAKYVHDFDAMVSDPRDSSRQIDKHGLLALKLQRFKKSRVVVSYYEHPRLAELYPGWTTRRLKATKAMVNQGMRDRTGSVEAPEVLLINGPSLVASAATLF